MSWLKNIKMVYKLGAAFLFLLIPLIFVISLLINSLNTAIHTTEYEIQGVEASQGIYKLIKSSTEHRDMLLRSAGPDVNLKSEMARFADKVSKDFDNLLINLGDSSLFSIQTSKGQSSVFDDAEELKFMWDRLRSDSLR